MNIFYTLLKKTGLFSIDLFYRIYLMTVLGSNLYERHKISAFKSCVFCQNLSYNKNTRMYACSCRHYSDFRLLLPCIIPDNSNKTNNFYVEEKEDVPWLFKAPCSNFKTLPSKFYFRNFILSGFNSSIIQLEALEGIFTGQCSNHIPCFICASVNKEAFTKCNYSQEANEIGKCCIIYDNLNECYSISSGL